LQRLGAFLVASFAAAAILAPAAFAQLTSDIVPRDRVVPPREEIEDDLDASRFHLGALRIRPLFALRDLGYNNNVFGSADTAAVADWTATVAGGGRATLPFGPKMYLRATVLPEYTWYQKLADRRFFGGTYSGSAVALFNRLSVQARGTAAKNLEIVSSELEAPAIRRLNDATLDAELQIFRRLSVFGTGEQQKTEYALQGAGIANDIDRVGELNRTERLTRGGVRYRFRSYFDIAVAAEETKSNFETRPQERDNKSDAVVTTLRYQRPRAYANISVADRRGKAVNGSAFPEYSTTTGSYFASYAFVSPIELQAYGLRHIVYGLFVDNPWFLETRNGGAIVLRPGTRFALRAFGDTGANAYSRPAAAFGSVARHDDVVTYGGGLAARLYRNAIATIIVSRSEYQSNVPIYSRSVLRVQTGISIGGLR
jgi:hypothetical protein